MVILCRIKNSKGGLHMKDVLKQVAYLQGLADGMELEDSKEGRVISEMLNLLEGKERLFDTPQDEIYRL